MSFLNLSLSNIGFSTFRKKAAVSLLSCAVAASSATAWANTNPVPDDAEFLNVTSYVAAGGHYIAYLVHESAVGQDLDGDGWTNDTVLQYQNVDTNQRVNTGIAVYNFRIETDGTNIVFLQRERNIEEDVNGNGHQRDVILGYYNIANQSVHYLPIKPTLNTGSRGQLRSYDIHGPMISYVDKELYIGHDVTGDGDTNDYVIRYWDFDQQQIVDTGLASLYADVSHGRLATTVSEGAMQRDLNEDGDTDDAVVLFADPNTGEYRVLHSYRDHNIINPNSYPAVDGWRVVFRKHERDEQADLNGDGRIMSQSVLFSADLTSNRVDNLGVIGTGQLWVRGDWVAYETSEHNVQQDINGDGDFQWDTLAGLTNIWTGETRLLQRGGEYYLGDRTLALRNAEFRLGDDGLGIDANQDGDTSDTIAFFVDVQQSAASAPPPPETPSQSSNTSGPGAVLASISEHIQHLNLAGEMASGLSQALSQIMTIVSNPSLSDSQKGQMVLPHLQDLVNLSANLSVASENQDALNAIHSEANMLLTFVQSM